MRHGPATAKGCKPGARSESLNVDTFRFKSASAAAALNLFRSQDAAKSHLWADEIDLTGSTNGLKKLRHRSCYSWCTDVQR
jgi:hypothetical protein